MLRPGFAVLPVSKVAYALGNFTVISITDPVRKPLSALRRVSVNKPKKKKEIIFNDFPSFFVMLKPKDHVKVVDRTFGILNAIGV